MADEIGCLWCSAPTDNTFCSRACNCRYQAAKQKTDAPDGLVEDYRSGLSAPALSEEYDIPTETIYNILDRLGVQRRDLKDAQQLRDGDYGQADGPYKDAEYLREQYHDEEMTVPEIAAENDVTPQTAMYWVQKHGIELRDRSEAQLANSPYNGERPHRYYGPSWNRARKAVIERDGACKVCGHDGSEDRLEVHHIRPFKTFDDAEEANRLENLVLLCQPCHTLAEYSKVKDLAERSEGGAELAPVM